MKKEEAIKWIDDRMCWGRGTFTEHHPPNFDECWEAGLMAIEALQADRPSGEWICKGDYAMCSKCGGLSDTQFDGVERIPKTTAFCPHCGADMRGEQDG